MGPGGGQWHRTGLDWFRAANAPNFAEQTCYDCCGTFTRLRRRLLERDETLFFQWPLAFNIEGGLM